MHYFGKVIVM